MESRKSGILSRTKDRVVMGNEGYLRLNRTSSITETGRMARVVEYVFVRPQDIGEQGISVFSADVVVVVMLEFSEKSGENTPSQRLRINTIGNTIMLWGEFLSPQRNERILIRTSMVPVRFIETLYG